MLSGVLQLVKPQLLSVLPSLVRHLSSDNYVTYTYAAISIERILFIRQGTQLMYVALQHIDGRYSDVSSTGSRKRMSRTSLRDC